MSEHLDELVNRFLAWKLPQTVCADLCATDNKYPHSRSGTNLLTATEARKMLEHVLSRDLSHAALSQRPPASGSEGREGEK